jgi:hypothetical protein
MNNTCLISIEDVLHVFGAWTLMTRASESGQLEAGSDLDLLDGSRVVIGKAVVKKFLPSRNPEIAPVEVSLADDSIDVKSIKFCRTAD